MKRRIAGGGWMVTATLGGGLVAFLAAEVYFIHAFLRALSQAAALAPKMASLLLERVVGAAIAVCLAMLLTSNLVAALGSFFRAIDLDLLAQTPLSRPTLLAHRFLKAAAPASIPVFVLLLPLTFTLDHHLGEDGWSPTYLAVASLGIVLTLIAPASLGCATTVLLMRFVPARFAGRLILASGGILAAGGVMALRFLRPERLAAPMSALDLDTFAAALRVPGEGWTPQSWLAELLVRGLDDPLRTLPLLIPIGAVGAASALASAFVILKFWEPAFLRSRENGRPTDQPPPLMASPSRGLSFLSVPTRALLDRELRYFVRDAARWSQLALLGGLLAVYAYNLFALASPDPISRLVLLYVDLATVGFVVASVALRFAFPAISAEGSGIVVIRAAPVSIRRVVLVKLAVVATPSLILATGLGQLTNVVLDVPAELGGLTLLASVAMGITLPAMAIGMGARFPRFDAADATEVISSPFAMASMLLGMAYIAVVVLAACRPIHRLALAFAGYPESWWEIPAAGAVIVVVSALASLWPLLSGIRALTTRPI